MKKKVGEHPDINEIKRLINEVKGKTKQKGDEYLIPLRDRFISRISELVLGSKEIQEEIRKKNIEIGDGNSRKFCFSLNIDLIELSKNPPVVDMSRSEVTVGEQEIGIIYAY